MYTYSLDNYLLSEIVEKCMFCMAASFKWCNVFMQVIKDTNNCL